MALYRETTEGEFELWKGEALYDPNVDMVMQYPLAIENTWSLSRLAGLGLWSPEPADDPAPGKRPLDLEVKRINGDVKFVWRVEDIQVTLDDLWAERDRRLAAGVDYDFGDARGVHHFKTTPADHIGWSKVTTLAQALCNLNLGDTLIDIATATGMTKVSASEWSQIIVAFGMFEQPIWGASFILEQINPLPADITNDAYWELPNAAA